MKGMIKMTSKIIMEEKIVFDINGRIVSLAKPIVDKYSDIVCPVTEHILSTFVMIFGKNCNDAVLSAKIESDMEQELKEYGF